MGWMVRHLFNVSVWVLISIASRAHSADRTQLRDNYFGTFTHFVTLEEYRHRHERNLQGDPLELKYRPGAVSRVCTSLEPVAVLMQSCCRRMFLKWLWRFNSTMDFTSSRKVCQCHTSVFFCSRCIHPFPCIELFDCQSAVVLVLPQMQVDLRNHDYFMGKSNCPPVFR